MSRLVASQRAWLAPAWVREDLSRKAQALPSLDLRFAESKSLTDAATGANLVTFTRASSGTYVGSDGVLKTATTNLLLQSEDFSTSWTLVAGTLSSNSALAPTGVSTADKLIATNGGPNGQVAQGITITSGATVTGSIFVKAGGFDRLELVLLSNNNTTPYGRATVNPNDGSITTAASTANGGTNASASVVNYGNGWYRFAVTVTYPAVTSAGMRLNVFNSDASNGDGVKGVFLWGAQLEQSSTVGEYIPTTSTINSAPRFDHNPTTGESLGLLVEEQRTNLLVQSENLGTTWTFSSASASTNTATAPDGQTSADTLIPGNGIANGLCRQDVAGLPDSTTYTLTVFLKSAGLNSVSLQFYNKANTFHGSKIIDLTNGALSGSDFVGVSSVVAYPNGWYRLIFTGLGSGTGVTTPNIRIICLATGNGTSGIYVWGAQLEAGSFPTSYIPTATATATRSADVASITGTNFSNFYSNTGSTALGYARSIGASTGTENVLGFGAALDGAQIRETSSQMIGMFRGTYGTDATSSLLPTGLRKMVIAYAPASTSVFAMNGIVYTGGTSSATLTNPNAMGIGSNGEINSPWNGTISRITYWPTRLADSTLQAITQ